MSYLGMAKQPLTTDAQRLDRIREISQQINTLRSELFELIPAVFPEKRGEEPVRGRLNEVVDATGWTRTYVANIRDGKVGDR